MIGAGAASARDMADEIGRLDILGGPEAQHCTVSLVAPGVLVTARHCLPLDPRRQLNALLGYDRGAFRRLVRSVAGDWKRLPLRDLAVLCDTGLDGGLDLSGVPIEGMPVTPRGYGTPRLHELSARRCHVLTPPAVGLVYMDCTVSQGMSGGPLLAGRRIVGTIIAQGPDHGIAERLDAETLAAACPERIRAEAPSRP
jgi:hypothetical protein